MTDIKKHVTLPKLPDVGPLRIRSDVEFQFPPKRLHMGYEISKGYHHTSALLEFGPFHSLVGWVFPSDGNP